VPEPTPRSGAKLRTSIIAELAAEHEQITAQILVRQGHKARDYLQTVLQRGLPHRSRLSRPACPTPDSGLPSTPRGALSRRLRTDLMHHELDDAISYVQPTLDERAPRPVVPRAAAVIEPVRIPSQNL